MEFGEMTFHQIKFDEMTVGQIYLLLLTKMNFLHTYIYLEQSTFLRYLWFVARLAVAKMPKG